MAAALDIDPVEVGGKAFRIGGATDFRDALGPQSIPIIKQRGRWASDISLVYQRALASEHIRASAAVVQANSQDLEALIPGWVQPATI